MSSYASSYSPIGSEYTIVARRDTHLIIECPADKKLLMKRVMGAFIAIFVIFSVYIVVMFGMLGFTLFSSTPALIILPIILVAFIGVLPAAMYLSMSKMAKPFTVELDKVANKMQMCTPNPYANQQGYARRNVYANFGQYFTIAWDLDKVVIRECLASEYSGPGAFSLKMVFKNKFIIVVTTVTWSYPVVFFASDRAELAQSLMGEIDGFLRGGPAPGGGWQAAGNEQPYSGR